MKSGCNPPSLGNGGTPELKTLLTRAQIRAGVRRLASRISRDYQGQDLLLVGLLKGSFVFLADLIRLISLPVEVDFIGLCSYHGGRTTGEVKVLQWLTTAIQGRHVILVEDIVDTGLTTGFALESLAGERPASLKLCSLLDKPARRRVPVTIDYLGFSVPDRFVVGYGIDYNQKYRNLPDICYVEGV